MSSAVLIGLTGNYIMTNENENKQDVDGEDITAVLSEINENLDSKAHEALPSEGGASEEIPPSEDISAIKRAKPKVEKSTEAKPPKPKAKKPPKPKPKKEEEELPPINYDNENLMSFARAATIIEDAMGYVDEPDIIGKSGLTVSNDEDASHPHHIKVTHGETVEVPLPDPEKQAAEKENKKASKAALKRANGTAVSRVAREKPSKKQRRTMFLGIFLSFFVIVGVFSTVWTIVAVAKDVVTSSSMKQKLSREIFPLVIIDTPEFDNPKKLDNSAIISSAIWAFIVDDNDKTKYRTDDLGSIFVPDVDIEFYVRKLFGPDVKITHQSVDDASVSMSYNPEGKTYIIEATPKFLPYTPRVENIKKTGNIYTLKVGYVMPSVLWDLEGDNLDRVADKTMEYKLQKVDDDYHVLSVTLLSIAPATGDGKPVGEPVSGGNPEDELYPDDMTSPEGVSPEGVPPVSDSETTPAEGAPESGTESGAESKAESKASDGASSDASSDSSTSGASSEAGSQDE